MPAISDLAAIKEFSPMKDSVNKESMKISPKGNLKIAK